MLRRCLESPNPCFGMIPPPRAAPSTSANGSMSTGNDYGTMLQIRNVQTFPDGRSLVETWGTWRFRVMERGMRDGYTVARIERIEDYEEELDPDAFPPPLSSPEDAQEPSSELEGRSARTSDAHASASPSGAHARESRAEEERADEQLEAALRAEIGDVLVRNPAQTEAASAATTPASTRSGPGASAIPPSSGLPDDRNDARRQEAGTATRDVKHDNGAAHGPAAKRAPTNAELIAKCHAFIEQTRQGTPWVVQHLHNNYVAMPTDPASFSFWMALLLPIDEHEKAKLLPIRSPRLRLRLVVHWIEQLNSHWANAYASASALQVVLWRVRYFMMLPRAVGVWVMLFAYTALLAAVYFGQALSGGRSPGVPSGQDRPDGDEL
ncbi:PUA-like domain-containing protein [Daedaleopsis nitida]|nr:PUA-like domain-containing protein [Daedaleopsis nitida]